MIDKLRAIGLTEYEAKVFLILTKHGSLIGKDIQKYSNVPHGRVYEVLGSLIERGFVTFSSTKPKIFTAIKPEIAVGQFLKRKINNLKTIEKELKKDLSKIKRIEPEIKAKEKILLLHTKEQLLEAHTYLNKITKKYQKMIFTYELMFTASRVKLMKRGVKFKIITARLNEKNRKFILEDIKRGIKVKYHPFDEFRMKTVDGKVSLVKIVVSKKKKEWFKSDWIAMLIESEELTKALEYYFDKVWIHAKEIT